MGTAKSYAGQCFCGEVRFTVTGEPAVMGYCHCESCRLWSAAPLSAFSLWPPAAPTASALPTARRTAIANGAGSVVAMSSPATPAYP